ncbi:hypothetical protein EDF67_101632 [Sphingobacterium sp. JUb78]|nr:hypothetical protein [Sphingobacterium sp. JUb56]MCW2259019.1 hypothetical protein [Sphingobacterium kitahiroshimense]TCR14528.1 hypothetical protein EDF67_101632 [Sphingobacterium sp. JUb78]
MHTANTPLEDQQKFIRNLLEFGEKINVKFH